ncbi:MAG: hypothetical protein J3R72DRAFT_170407 [Linnemannia gamsii]|nr:MAG: hypothetical protein J3R72DRAFT_170407 [Linnemannia gamsii]
MSILRWTFIYLALLFSLFFLELSYIELSPFPPLSSSDCTFDRLCCISRNDRHSITFSIQQFSTRWTQRVKAKPILGWQPRAKHDIGS